MLIHIKVGWSNPQSSSVKVSGYEKHVITDVEAKTFGLDSSLVAQVELKFGRKRNWLFSQQDHSIAFLCFMCIVNIVQRRWDNRTLCI
mmetsp:Transcript_5136/g.7915  ORF Transcript_5136/g.7915 Transcript_5136/m.7915 type:complete len:88 (-) Transcript_5136:641-904(-)